MLKTILDRPGLLALITIALWSFGGALGRLLSIKSQFLLQSMTFGFSALFFLGYQATIYHGALFKKLLGEFKLSHYFFGIFGYFVYVGALAQSYRQFDGASETVLLNYTWPLFTIIFTMTIFGRKAKRPLSYRLVQQFGILMGFAAVIIVGTRGDFASLDLSNGPGIAWGLMGGMSYGLFSAFSSTVAKDEQGLFLLRAVLFSLLLMSLVSLSELDVIGSLTLSDVLIAASTGLFMNGLGYITWTRANRLAYELQIDISSIASIMFVLPVLSLGIIALMFGEDHLTQPYFLMALLLILLSSIFCQKPDFVLKWLGMSNSLHPDKHVH
ncbi:MAG: hypothetical protein CL607_17005 [Anaerolineaceae bacterium]|nr:hypothetical protein [Anaerolineaceae bacterium]